MSKKFGAKIQGKMRSSDGPTAPTNTMDSPYLTTAEAALFLRISEEALRVRVMRKQITAYKSGKRLLFKKKELVRVIEKNRVGYEFGY